MESFVNATEVVRPLEPLYVQAVDAAWPYWEQYELFLDGVWAKGWGAMEQMLGHKVDRVAAGLSTDDVTKDFFLMRKPWITITLVMIYLALIPIGVRFMRNREAFKLKGFMTVYNLSLVCLSVYMCAESIYTAYLSGFDIRCQPVVSTKTPLGLRMANVVWWYYFSKCIEFMDTFAMVLRKKNNQITVLHLWHHSTMFILWWIQCHCLPGGHAFFGVAINSFIHVLMYSYYFGTLTGIGLNFFRFLKPHLTKMQLIQFFMTIAHAYSGYTLNCGYPRPPIVLLVTYMCTLVILFSNFYFKSYLAKKDAKKGSSNGEISNGHKKVQ